MGRRSRHVALVLWLCLSLWAPIIGTVQGYDYWGNGPVNNDLSNNAPPAPQITNPQGLPVTQNTTPGQPPVQASARPPYPSPTPSPPPTDQSGQSQHAKSESTENAGGASGEKSDEPEFKEERFNAHGQLTTVTDWNDGFRSPYSGPNSFQSMRDEATSETSTLFLGARLWQGFEAYFDPEIAGGTGLSSVYGLAAFPNGEITRVGTPEPTPYVARLYFSQAFGWGDEQEKLIDGPNQVAEYKQVNRVTVTAGKFSASDFLDNNRYSHDPRVQFMNWALMYNAAWDFPADVRGYTYGVLTELNQKDWAIRYGIFAEPLVANGPDIDPNIGKAHGQAVEFERRYELNDHPGKARIMGYWNRADMGNYDQALAMMPVDPEVTATRTYNSVKYGVTFNMEQEITDNLGAFLRLGWNDGHTETWAYTEADRTCAIGFVLQGDCWGRKLDQLGTAFVVDGLSGPHERYLAAGGLGFELGDGKLNYSNEFAWETYYSFCVRKETIWVTPDFQFIGNPGYNADRGPVLVGGLRVHCEF